MSKFIQNCLLRTSLPSKVWYQRNQIRHFSIIQTIKISGIQHNHWLSDNIKYCKNVPFMLCETKFIGRRSYSNDFPSHNKVMLPALSPTMEMGTIVNWSKKEGDKLSEGDLLAEIETDKATMGFETPEEGYLAKILVPAGTKDVPIGKLVCIIVENQGNIDAFKDYKDDSPSTPLSMPLPTSPPSLKSAPVSPPKEATSAFTSFASPQQSKNRIFASPLAKRLAAEKGLSLESVKKGSGIFGSIKAKDLSKAGASSKLSSMPSTSAVSGERFEDCPISNVRNVIAKRLIQSKQTIPHYYLTVDLNLDEIIKLRKKMNESLEKVGHKLTINDFIIKATALASKKIPEANSAWMDTFIRQYNSVDVSVAVSTDNGLITPIVFDADKKGLLDISNDIKILAVKAREGCLQPHEFQGGTISVSNLGMFNIKSVSSIINPPQACILGVGSVQQRLIPDKNSEKGTKVGNMIQMTLSCDHRVVDGAVGAKWLIEFRQLIEEPHNMLL